MIKEIKNIILLQVIKMVLKITNLFIKKINNFIKNNENSKHIQNWIFKIKENNNELPNEINYEIMKLLNSNSNKNKKT